MRLRAGVLVGAAVAAAAAIGVWAAWPRGGAPIVASMTPPIEEAANDLPSAREAAPSGTLRRAALPAQTAPVEVATVLAGTVAAGAAPAHPPPVVVAAARLELAGMAIDGRGNPIDGVELRCRLPADFAARFALPLDAAKDVHASNRASSSVDGRFRLAAGAVPGAQLVAIKSNFLPASIELPERSTDDLRIVLHQPPADEDAVLGQVLDPLGAPVPEALVCLGPSGATTSGDGRFALSRSRSSGERVLRAMKRGWLPVRLEIPEPVAGAPPPFVYVQLEGPPLAITGRVVDDRGAGVAGARVWAMDGEPFAGTPGHVSLVEAYLAGGATVAELRARAAGDPTADLGELRVRQPTSFWGWVETDGAGRFALEGLQRKDYRLRVFAQEGLRMVDAGPFPAGSDGVEIRFAVELRTVAGRLVGLDGTGVADVAVHANSVPIRMRLQWPDGRAQHNAEPTHDGPVQRTDAEGRFRFAGLGARELFLTVRGEGVLVQHFGLDEGGLEAAGLGPLDGLRIEVARRVEVRVELGDASAADAFTMLDARGETLPISSYAGGGQSVAASWPVRDGRTPVLAVSEAAQTVVLWRAGREVARIAVVLQPGTVNVVRP